MKKIQPKKILPLLSSIAVLSGPVLLVVACDHDIKRYDTSLPSNDQNKIILDFVGVNYSKTAQTEFKAALGNTNVMKAVQKQVEGIMAKQQFFDFFTKKLNYSEDKANKTFENIKNNIGLNILANNYFSALNSGKNFDGDIYNNNDLIFQTDNWFLNGTNKFDYTQDPFYNEESHNPNKIFTTSYLYDELDDDQRTQNIIDVATYADSSDVYNKLMANKAFSSGTYSGPTTPPLPAPVFDKSASNPVNDYQKKLERFKWLLRFRYSRYYAELIEPQLNEDLFTMSNILDTILRISNDNKNPIINIDTGTYPDQLQSWGDTSWTTNFRYTWDYTTSVDSAQSDEDNWDDTSKNVHPDLITQGGQLNPDFFNKFASDDKTVKNVVDPIFGINGHMTTDKVKTAPYKDAINTGITINRADWVVNNGSSPSSHWWQSNNKGKFAYTTPIFWLDDILNLNFNWGNDQSPDNAITIDQALPDNNRIISNWTGSQSLASKTPFSEYIRYDNKNDSDYVFRQNLKWNLFWQMIYSIATKSTTDNTNGDLNYGKASKALYPKYIKKENVYSNEFWNQINGNYS